MQLVAIVTLQVVEVSFPRVLMEVLTAVSRLMCLAAVITVHVP